MRKFFVAFVIILGMVYSITTCQEITGSGLNLYLENDINAGGRDCIVIEGTNINLDCNGYTIYNASTGVMIRNSVNVNLTDCNVQNSTVGIWVGKRAVGNSSIQNLTSLQNPTNAILKNTNITNTTKGIEVYMDSGNTIRFANVKNSSIGIHLKNALLTLVENSTITNNENGIVLNNSAKFNDENYPERNYGNNTVRNNFILNNRIGVNITYSGFNRFYNNYFNNTKNVESDSLFLMYLYNLWNSSYNCSQSSIIGGRCMGGNFWNDYTGYDSGEGIHPHNESFDGVGDTHLPYMPYGEAFGDSLPLTKAIPPNWIMECRNITSSGTYIVKKYIYGVQSDANRVCIRVLAHNVEINCYGYRIIDNTTYTDSYGVYVDGYNNLILKNCSIINYTTGLYERGSTYGTLLGNNFSNDKYNIYFNYDVDSTPPITFFYKNITTDNYVDGKQVYYFLNGVTGDGYTPPAPSNAGMIAYINTNNAYITGRSLSKNSPVIILLNVTNGLVEKNKIDMVGDAIYVGFGRNISVMDSNFSNVGRYVIGVSFSNTTTISKNRIENGSTTSSVYAYQPNNISISYNNASNLRVFCTVYNSSGYVDVFNNIGYVGYNGCGFYDTPGARVYGNTFIGMNYSPNLIYVAGFYSGQIYNNTLLGYAQRLAGIIIGAGTYFNNYNISIYNNTIIGNETSFTYDSVGIDSLMMHYNLSIYKNVIKNIRFGIRPNQVASNLTIFNNTIYNTSVGIFIYDCACNGPYTRCINVYSNNITLSASYAIEAAALLPPCGNAFYNNFIYSTTGNWAYGSSFTDWNITKNCTLGPNIIGGPCWGGNAWFAPGGNVAYCDADGDGIGEGEFTFLSGIDYLPLNNERCKAKSVKIEVPEKNLTVDLPTRIKIK
ncbi:MAG: NosD domain-containing protein [Candidatus Micrarchaeia archaeon]